MLKKLIAIFTITFWCSSIQAATLQVSDGQLTGASGVDVGGILYNVSFESDTCVALYNGCDETSDFPFTVEDVRFDNPDEAVLAAIALRDQVFLDVPEGNFDTVPSLTAGCSAPIGLLDVCLILFPWGFEVDTSGIPDFDKIHIMVLENTAFVTSDGITFSGYGADAQLESIFIYAVWTPHSAVPVPAAIWLFGTALIGLVGFSKRRKAA